MNMFELKLCSRLNAKSGLQQQQQQQQQHFQNGIELLLLLSLFYLFERTDIFHAPAQ